MFLILIFPLCQWEKVAMTTFFFHIFYMELFTYLYMAFFYFLLENISNPFFHTAKCLSIIISKL